MPKNVVLQEIIFRRKNSGANCHKKYFESDDEYGKCRANEQIIYQNQNYKVTLTSPAKNKITKNTRKITGRAYKNSRIILCDSDGKTKIQKTITDKKGKFVLPNLNLKKWAGKNLVIKISLLSPYGDYNPASKSLAFKVRKNNQKDRRRTE